MARSAGVSLLIGRIVVGLVFILHGWQKLVTNGMDATVSSFANVGYPVPEFFAWFTALVELIGGVAFILGAALPIVGTLLAMTALFALIFVNFRNGFWNYNGGYEYLMVLAGTSLALGFASSDYAVGGAYRRYRGRRVDA